MIRCVKQIFVFFLKIHVNVCNKSFYDVKIKSSLHSTSERIFHHILQRSSAQSIKAEPLIKSTDSIDPIRSRSLVKESGP